MILLANINIMEDLLFGILNKHPSKLWQKIPKIFPDFYFQFEISPQKKDYFSKF